MKQHITQRRNRGYTLVEAVMMVGVFIALAVMVSTVVLYLYRVNAHSIAQAVSLSSATKGMESIVQDIRGAMYADDGAYPLATMASSSIIFYADIDSDGKAERVRYFLSGTDISRGVIEPTSASAYPTASEVVEVVTHDVQNFSKNMSLFRYYDANGSEITLSSGILDVRLVKTELVVNADPGRQMVDVSLRSSASLRNIKTL